MKGNLPEPKIDQNLQTQNFYQAPGKNDFKKSTLIKLLYFKNKGKSYKFS